MTTEYTNFFKFALPDFNASPWRETFAQTLRNMDKVIYNALFASGIAPWANSHAYAASDIAIDTDGVLWIVAVAHTSAAAGTFAADRAANPTYWREVGAVPVAATWATATAYTINTFVTNGYKYAVVTQGHTSTTFDADVIAGKLTVLIDLEPVFSTVLSAITGTSGGATMIGGKLVTSVASNALTIAIKTLTGNDPSVLEPVYIRFRDSTQATDSGLWTIVNTATSIVISSGSTLGHVSAREQHIFVYAVNNGGVAELAVSNLPPDYGSTFSSHQISTTAEGGAGAADSATGIYSTTARSNVAWASLAMMKSTQTTAGTWAAVPTQIDLAPFIIPKCSFVARQSAAQTLGSASQTILTIDTIISDPNNCYDNVTNYRFQPKVAGLYNVTERATIDSLGADKPLAVEIWKNGARECPLSTSSSIAMNLSGQVADMVLFNGTSDYVDFQAVHTHGSNRNTLAGVGGTRASASRVTA